LSLIISHKNNKLTLNQYMSTNATALVSSHPFEFNGKTYHVSLITQAVKIAFEEKLFGISKEGIRIMKDMLTPEQYVEQVMKLHDKFINGHFTMESELGQSKLKTVQGILMLASIMFGVEEMEMITIISSQPAEVQALIQQIMKESLPDADKKKVVPEQAGTTTLDVSVVSTPSC
jgi:hypothetical protein